MHRYAIDWFLFVYCRNNCTLCCKSSMEYSGNCLWQTNVNELEIGEEHEFLLNLPVNLYWLEVELTCNIWMQPVGLSIILSLSIHNII